jgi:predicted Zn-dependent peptidase
MSKKMMLENGVTMLVDEIESSGAVSLGAWIELGSRDEKEGEQGFAHLIEHMLFKGTERRSAYDIAAQVDSFGGEINGSTSKENTYYFVNVASDHWRDALDILLDMYFRSSFRSVEFERERLIVLDEINMAMDDPEDYVGELYFRAMWGEHPLGLPVFGNRENIATLSLHDLVQFHHAHYPKRGLILSVAGNITADSFRMGVEELFEKRGYLNGSMSEKPLRGKPRAAYENLRETRDITQVHVLCGVEAFGYADDRRFALTLLNIILGSSFSSRLFQRIREELGLCYSVSTSAINYSDCGEFGIGFSTSLENLPRVLEEIDLELTNVIRNGIKDDELERAKDKFRGNYILAKESIEWKMIRMALQEMLYGRLIPYDQTLSRIEAVEPKHIEEVVQLLFRERQFNFASVGPYQHEARIRDFRYSFSPSLPHTAQ